MGGSIGLEPIHYESEELQTVLHNLTELSIEDVKRADEKTNWNINYYRLFGNNFFDYWSVF